MLAAGARFDGATRSVTTGVRQGVADSAASEDGPIVGCAVLCHVPGGDPAAEPVRS
ncbi:hypothetical protein BN2537_3107 [Streptomyces venezuelae]|nr:hypothetical protein BN2537_3107 [Streptomyces venezuelae]